MAERTLASYASSKVNFATGAPTSLPQLYMPFPGGAGSKIWYCPSAYMSPADVSKVSGNSWPSVGYFAYAQSLDLNKIIGSSTGGLGSEPANVDTTMPKVSALPKPSATVYMFDCAFNPNTEIDDPFNPGDSIYNSTLPGLRFKTLASRHFQGSVINFCDGHVKYFRDSYLTNGITEAMWSAKTEVPNPDVIWDPAYRYWLGH
jgi:hypothetical protein